MTFSQAPESTQERIILLAFQALGQGVPQSEIASFLARLNPALVVITKTKQSGEILGISGACYEVVVHYFSKQAKLL